MSDTADTPLLKRTLVTTAIMLGACVAFVGTLSLLAALIVGKAVDPSASGDAPGGLVPATNVHGTPSPDATGAAVKAGDAQKPAPRKTSHIL
jgi:hypothetical protein